MRARMVTRLGQAFVVLTLLAATLAAQPRPAGDKKKDRPIEQPGEIEAYERVPLYSKIAGFIAEWRVDIGDRVKKGDVLARLDVPEMELEAARRKALLRKAEIGVKQAQQSVVTLTAALDRSKAEILEAQAGAAKSQANMVKWQAEHERVQKLVASGAVDRATADGILGQLKAAQADFDQAKAKVKVAEAAQKAAESKREQGLIGVDLAQAGLEVAKADAEAAKAVLQYAVIAAPFDGVVTMRGVHVGEYVRPPTGEKAEPLFIVARVDVMRVNVQVPESQALEVHKGMQAAITVTAVGKEVFKGKVTRTAGALDPKARTLLVVIDLPNPDGKLLAGMYANVVLSPKKQ